MILVMDDNFIEFLYRIVFPGAVGRLALTYDESMTAKKLTDYIWDGMPEELKKFYHQYHEKKIAQEKMDLFVKLQFQTIEALKMQLSELTKKENDKCKL